MKNFYISIAVNSSQEEVTGKINQVNKWWAKKVKGKSEKLNDKFKVDFGKTFVDFQINELVPGKRVVWKVTDCNLHWIDNKKEWNGNEILFEISSANNKTKIDFTHIGLVPGVECYDDCKVGWTEHIQKSLANFIDKGEGQPQ